MHLRVNVCVHGSGNSMHRAIKLHECSLLATITYLRTTIVYIRVVFKYFKYHAAMVHITAHCMQKHMCTSTVCSIMHQCTQTRN